MIITNLHKEPTALDTVVHRDLRLDNTLSAIPLLAQFTSFAITLGEFSEAGRDFPLLFIKAGTDDSGKESVAPVAVFGLKPGENLFAQGEVWSGSYLPAILRAYPFTMARIADTDRWAMVFDNSWKGLSRKATASPASHPLFDEKGEGTELLNNIHRFVQELETDLDRTRQGCAMLLEMKLLKPMRFDATLANGETVAVDGFLTLDEDALRALSDAQIAGLFRNGLLGILQTHQLSLGNMRRLLDRRLARTAS